VAAKAPAKPKVVGNGAGSKWVDNPRAPAAGGGSVGRTRAAIATATKHDPEWQEF
jgi:hypothetical protein